MPNEQLLTSPPRILLVEDDEAAVYIFRRKLTALGYEVETTFDALQAIQMLSETSYAAVVLDLVMPGPMNGFAVISFIETEMPDLIRRVFITSGMPEQTIVHTAPQLLPRFYRKPFDFDEVVAKIQTVVRGETPPQNQKRVLVVDDDRDTRQIVARIASRIGHETVEAENGQDAIRHLAGGGFSALILDLLMPHVDGYGVLRYLREEQPRFLERTIVMTGMPARYRQNPLLDGISILIEKPPDSAVLRSALADCTRG